VLLPVCHAPFRGLLNVAILLLRDSAAMLAINLHNTLLAVRTPWLKTY